MLADLALDPSYDYGPLGHGMKLWQRKLRDAQKFVIDRDLASVIDAMPRSDVGAAMPFCRLPFPVCWIEVAHMDRPRFAAKGVATDLFMPVRVGILCEQAGDDPRQFWATLCWSFSDADTRRQSEEQKIPNLAPLSVCIQACYLDTGTPGHWPASVRHEAYDAPFTLDPLWAPYWRSTLEKVTADGLVTIAKNAENDWQGEIWFWLGALALVNARNGVDSSLRPAEPRLNRARLKAGKPALVDYHQLTLRVAHRSGSEAREGGSGGHMRAHTVRGHFKVRKTGIFWWSHFMRGDVAEGFAGKRYKVKL